MEKPRMEIDPPGVLNNSETGDKIGKIIWHMESKQYTASLSAVLIDQNVIQRLYISGAYTGAGGHDYCYEELFTGTPLGYHIKFRNLQV